LPASATTKILKCDHGLRRRMLVESVLADVFRGRLRPEQRLITQDLADRFGVSHTPIREALIELAAMGIVDLLPNRGAVVRRVSPVEVREVCQVRRVLECEATRRACGRIEIAELRELRKSFRDLMSAAKKNRACFIDDARALDTHLHDLIASSCGNRFLANEISRLKILFRAFRDIMYLRHEERNDFHRLAGEAKEHLAIVDGLLASDRVAASKAMARHIHSGAKYWSRALPEGSARSKKK
jgi:DNA-binding GntR family transcriptional regulator